MQGNRRWIRLALLGVLIVVAVASIVLILLGSRTESPAPAEITQAPVIVALRPLAAGQVLTAKDVGVQLWDSASLPSGAVTRLQDAMGQVLGRDLNAGDILLVTDLSTLTLTEPSPAADPLDQTLGSEWVAVALQAPDLWSQWGGIQPGDHLDLLASLEVTVSTPSLPVVVGAPPSMTLARPAPLPEPVILWTIQDLEVLQVIQEPLTEALGDESAPPLPYIPARRLLLILKASPQDAAILHFLQHTDATLDLARRAGQNERQFDVDAVTLDYLLNRYSPDLRRRYPYPEGSDAP